MNWPGLMAWSTKYHDGTAPSKFKVLSDEDRKFLEQAMKEAYSHVEDPNKVFKEVLDQVRSPDRTNESLTTALEVIDRLCDDVDVARNVEKLDGTQPLLDLVTAPDASWPVRVRTLEILALLFSNNPHIQKVGVERGALPMLLSQVRSSATGSEERLKAFRTLVALIRQVTEYEDDFTRNNGGVAMMVDCLSEEEDPRTREKSASFVRHLACTQRLLAEDAGPLVAALAALLPSTAAQNVQYRETLSGAAAELARAFPGPCAPLASAAQARLAEARDAAGTEDVEQEVGSLLECLECMEDKAAIAAIMQKLDQAKKPLIVKALAGDAPASPAT